MLYAMSLGYTNNNQEAEKEFGFMKGRFSNYEARYNYGLFLKKYGRDEEAKKTFVEMVDEYAYLGPREKRNNRQWFNHAKEELKGLEQAKMKV